MQTVVMFQLELIYKLNQYGMLSFIPYHPFLLLIQDAAHSVELERLPNLNCQWSQRI